MIKDIQIGNEEVKLLLFADDLIGIHKGHEKMYQGTPRAYEYLQ